jgi:lipopolysaccharide transport system ATP-binding protein
MNDNAIQVEHLGKRYRLGQHVGYQTMRETLVNVFSAPFRRNGRGANAGPGKYMWALKDVSFEVKHGEAIGIIGRNGAGKTTLLKVLSRITEPTEGRAWIRGRVGSLLEVGTGFHPELTGRENVYLNGAVLGMKKKEIDRKFDEIIEFAGVKNFIDTPLKRFSSGMQVRLAFSVAAHLEPEILLVDEVLAVGDLDFQKKCLGKMGEVTKGGRTVLFVSHNMGNIANLCPKTILLEHGRVAMIGDTRDVIAEYIGDGANNSGEVTWDDPATAPGNETVRLKAVRTRSNGKVTSDVLIDEDINIEIDYWNLKEGATSYIGIDLFDKMNSYIFTSANWPSANLVEDSWAQRPRPAGVYRTTCVIPKNFLNSENYLVNVVIPRVMNGQDNTRVENAISFMVHETGAMRKECLVVRWGGVIRPKLAWSTIRLNGKVNEDYPEGSSRE